MGLAGVGWRGGGKMKTTVIEHQLKSKTSLVVDTGTHSPEYISKSEIVVSLNVVYSNSADPTKEFPRVVLPISN